MSDHVTPARARKEQLELVELSSDDSPYNPTTFDEESSEISFFTDSDGVERVEGYMSEESVDEPPQEVNIRAMAMVDLNQFFNRMERHMERQMEMRTTENIENPVLRVLKEMRSYSDE